jgi:multisubunit Na+/H+ antiporter MnhB subunit
MPAVYRSIVSRSQPWPAGAEDAQRIALSVVYALALGTVLGAAILFYMLGFRQEHRHAAQGGLIAGAYFVLSTGINWLMYRRNKARAIRSVNQSGRSFS